jgi:hypothetical protein
MADALGESLPAALTVPNRGRTPAAERLPPCESDRRAKQGLRELDERLLTLLGHLVPA